MSSPEFSKRTCLLEWKGDRILNSLPKRSSIYIYASPNSAHERRIIQGVADYARLQSPPLEVRWGAYLTEELLARHSFDGLLVFAMDASQESFVDKLKIPVVNVSSRNREWKGASVIPDNEAIGKMAAEHFKERLYRNFLFVGTEVHTYCPERFESFKAALSPYHCKAHWVDDNIKGGPDAASSQLSEYIENLPAETAIFAANDIFARRVCDIIFALQRKIPMEFAILGVDADEMMSLASPVGISSINPDAKRIGREAGALVDGLIKGSRSPETIHIAPSGIVVEASTDHLATADIKIAEAIQIIRMHACQGLTVIDLAQSLGMGRRTIEQQFREVTGSGIHEEIQKTRIQRACELLNESVLTVSEIADKAGFSSLYYFSSTFKKHMGISPKDYRSRLFRFNIDNL